jgi:hypothetical protein
MFSRAAAWAEELGAKRATDAHQQGRGSLSANGASAGRALHFGPFGEDRDLRRWGLKLAER